jgi:Txe/YoeB family toxin of Txe-Axe toxin-antitoxin module
MQTFAHWQVAKYFADPMYNYLVHGWTPGSCFTSVLANDFASAIARSHPSNTVEAFKALVGWIRDTMPREAYGSYEAVDKWTKLDSDQRRTLLEQHNLVFTSKEEVVKVLKDEPSSEPVLY